MERIVIFADRLDHDNGLAALLNTIFPECDIAYVYGDMDDHAADRKGPLPRRSIVNCSERGRVL